MTEVGQSTLYMIRKFHFFVGEVEVQGEVSGQGERMRSVESKEVLNRDKREK